MWFLRPHVRRESGGLHHGHVDQPIRLKTTDSTSQLARTEPPSAVHAKPEAPGRRLGPGRRRRRADARALGHSRGVVDRVLGHDHASRPRRPAQAHDLGHHLGVRGSTLLRRAVPGHVRLDEDRLTPLHEPLHPAERRDGRARRPGGVASPRDDERRSRGLGADARVAEAAGRGPGPEPPGAEEPERAERPDARRRRRPGRAASGPVGDRRSVRSRRTSSCRARSMSAARAASPPGGGRGPGVGERRARPRRRAGSTRPAR